jgi:hypothetical protein
MANLGSAWVNVSPTGFPQFGAETKAGLAAALKGVTGNVPVTADTKPAAAQVAAFGKLLPKLLGDTSVTIGADDSPALAHLAGLKAALTALQDKISNIPVGVDDTPALAKVAALQVALNKLTDKAYTVTPEADLAPLTARMLALTVTADKLKGSLADVVPEQLAGDVAGLGDALGKADSGIVTTGNALGTLKLTVNGAEGAFGFLGTQLTLFGGVFDNLLPKMFNEVPVWHLLTDAVIETAAALIPATIAFGAFAIAGIPAMKTIVTQMQTLSTESTALGTSIYPLSGGFAKMANAVRPEVYQLFGEALELAGRNTGTFAELATGAGSALDRLGARFVVAMTQGRTASTFFKTATDDLAGIGTVIGNLGGIFGNLFKAMPGWAEILLGLTGTFTHLAEVFTGSGLVQGLLNAGLWMHGFIIYAGLATTAVLKLQQPLLALGSMFLGLGVKVAAYVGSLAAAEGATATFEAALAPLAANPMLGVALAAGALVGLAVIIAHSTTAVQNFYGALQKGLQNVPLLQLSTTLQSDQAVSASKLADATTKLGQTQEFVTGTGTKFGASVRSVSAAYTDQKTAVAQNTAGMSELQAQQQLVTGRLSELGKTMGGTAGAWTALNEAGITSSQVLDKNNADWQVTVAQIQATKLAMAALSVGTGQQGAMNNALRNSYINVAVPAMQKATTAEETLLSTILGSRQGFITFEQNMQQMGTDAKVAGASINGLNSQSLTLSSDFLTAVTSGQKLVDSLQASGISTKSLTTATATAAGQMLQYAGTNTEARQTVVDMIVGALGPGTVSLKTLNSWVKNNSTSLDGFNNIVAQATVKASTLADALSSQLNVQFRDDLLASSGASKGLDIYAGDLAHSRDTTVAGRQDRLNLIKDLENSGYSAQQAADKVNNLTSQIDHIPGGKLVKITVDGQGTWDIFQNSNPGAKLQQALISGTTFANGAEGMLVSGGTPNKDSVPILAMAGETVVPKHLTPMVAPLMKAHNVPGFASGGQVGGNISQLGNWTTTEYGSTVAAMTQSVADAMTNGIKSAISAAQAALSGGYNSVPAQSGSAAAAQAFAAAHLSEFGFGANQMPALIALWNAESGWNADAVNSSSGAYGIPQALGKGHPYALGDYANQVLWGLAYIKGRYGSPSAAESHELGYGWYDQGGLLKPGLTLAYNGTGKNEVVSPAAPAAQQGATLNDVVRALNTVQAQLNKLTAVTGQQGAAFGNSLSASARAGSNAGYYR